MVGSERGNRGIIREGKYAKEGVYVRQNMKRGDLNDLLNNNNLIIIRQLCPVDGRRG